jgi:hypothetical protein
MLLCAMRQFQLNPFDSVLVVTVGQCGRIIRGSMTTPVPLKQICFLLLDEVHAYEILIGEIEQQLEPAFLRRRLIQARRRSALGLGAAAKYSEIERKIEELELTRDWRKLLQEAASMKPKPPVN